MGRRGLDGAFRRIARSGAGRAEAAAQCGRDLDVARRIRSGTVGVNGGSWFAPDVPFGGYKSSGVGRQNGLAGFEQYLETKSVAWPIA